MLHYFLMDEELIYFKKSLLIKKGCYKANDIQ